MKVSETFHCRCDVCSQCKLLLDRVKIPFSTRLPYRSGCIADFLFLQLSVCASPGRSVEDDTTVPVHGLAGAGHSKVRRRFHRLHWSSTQDQGTVWPGRPNHGPLQVWGTLRNSLARTAQSRSTAGMGTLRNSLARTAQSRSNAGMGDT